MFNSTSIVFFILSTALSVLSPVMSFGSEQIIHILYTGNGYGEIEPCGCSEGSNFGGLKRRGEYIKNLPDEVIKNAVIIETGDFSAEEGDLGDLKTELLFNAMSIIGYDAVLAGKSEEKIGETFIHKLAEKYELPFLSSSMKGFPDILKKRVNGLDIYIHTSFKDSSYANKGFHILMGNYIIDDSAVGESVDLLLYTGKEYRPAFLDKKRVVSSIKEDEGKTIGLLSITVGNKGEVLHFQETQTLLTDSFQDDDRLKHYFEQYNQDVAAVFKKKNQEKEDKAGIFLGDQNCKECHDYFWSSWKETKHASAWETLEKKGKTSDPDCVQCHTVAFGLEGGFISGEKTPHLKSVQCEVCHGSGKDHVLNYSRRLPAVTSSVCVTCHNKKHSPEFNFDTFLPLIKH